MIERVENELYEQVSFPATGVQSLAWRDDELVDWAGGHRVFRLDGTDLGRSFMPYGGSFDAAIAAADSRHVVVFQRLGTKALLLRDGRLARELNRSFYQASAYEYPVTFVRLPEGRTGLVHCPDKYCRLEIEDAETGERLTAVDRNPEDFFHSRLAASADGRYLVSAGWIWHPIDAACVFDVAAALGDPTTLDRGRPLASSSHVGRAEIAAVAWMDDRHVVVAGSHEPEDPEEIADAGDAPRLRPDGLAVVEVDSGNYQSSVVVASRVGTVMAVGRRRAVSFFGQPQLIDLATGSVLAPWDIASGEQAGSILWHRPLPPPIALDPTHHRFAVAVDDRIVVVHLRSVDL